MCSSDLAKQSVMQQVAPDYNMQLTQNRFAKYFASLQVTKINNGNNPPTYQVNVITQQGFSLLFNVQVPT